MRPSYQPRLINDPFDDPGLFVPFLFERRAFLFDLGDLSRLSSKELLKVTHVFITHAHMDHFIGFDHLIRLFLGRQKRLHLFGPEPFLHHVTGKLSGYSWDLVKNYDHPLILTVTQVSENRTVMREFDCRKGFFPGDPESRAFAGKLYQTDGLTVSASIFEHSIPCLGFSMKERFHVNIRKEVLLSMGIQIGPWLKAFKEALFASDNPEKTITVPMKGEIVPMSVKDLSAKIALITPGQKLTYISDIGFTRANEEKAINMAAGSDHLFIEASFLQKEKGIALQKRHLTAWQAGMIAGKAGVKQYTLFHFSPRYTGRSKEFQNEAAAAYGEALGF